MGRGEVRGSAADILALGGRCWPQQEMNSGGGHSAAAAAAMGTPTTTATTKGGDKRNSSQCKGNLRMQAQWG